MRPLQRQDAVVLQQRHGVDGGDARDGLVQVVPLVGPTLVAAPGGDAALVRRLVQAHPVDGRDNARCCVFNKAWLELRQDLVGPQPVVARHVLVQAALHRPLVLVGRAPVGLHEAAEAHLPFQVALEQLGVGARMCAVHLVVGAHERADAGFDGGLEGRVVQLPGRARVDVDVACMAIRLLLVERKVLRDGHHALALHALDEGAGQLRAQERVIA
mmetsp:Transcript_60211/g.176713  ORF Transcript_60211/g.176713 Transcript_60211/m.176713 type:complete len:215 (+) Transcript_60211:1044-1688(+)